MQPTEVSRWIWETKYRFDGGDRPEQDIGDSWRRVAAAVASVEPEADRWRQAFLDVLQDWRFLPGGRILAGAGTGRQVTLFNCFVMGIIEDSLDGIFDALKEGALTMQQGGGVGYDFSTLRPWGTRARGVGGTASGPVSFMRIWDRVCDVLLSTGSRRGAMMASLRCDHPDIQRFIRAKQAPGELANFNLSVQVTDDFMRAVERDADWPLLFPAAALEHGEGPLAPRVWTGSEGPLPCRVLRSLPARALWDELMTATYEGAEPGVLFVDRIQRLDNLGYRERITTTNPCGEIPLPPYGACDLGSINLTRFVLDPFSDRARLDRDAIARTVAVAVRLLDDVVDLSRFPLPAQAEQARGSRRIGLGITGLADALLMLGLRYDSEQARTLAAEIMRDITLAAYRASIALAREKGPFPFFERDAYLASAFIQGLPDALRDDIARDGIRNSHLTAIAPTGTISLLAGNVSSALEPLFRASYRRRVRDARGRERELELTDYAVALWQRQQRACGVPPAFVAAHELAPEDHLAMQAALQPWVDNAISKTINVPADYPFADFAGIYRRAWELGLKGCTSYRPNPLRGEVLGTDEAPASHCCTLDREGE